MTFKIDSTKLAAHLEAITQNVHYYFGAADVLDNWKNTAHNIFVKSEQVLNVAYYEPCLIDSFASLLAKVLDNGWDMEHPNQIICSESLRGTDMLHIGFVNPKTTFKLMSSGEDPFITEFLTFDCLTRLMDSWLIELQGKHKVKTVFIDCLSIYAADVDPFTIQQELARLAHEHEVMFIVGWQLFDEVPGIDKIDKHLSVYDSSLAYLTKEDDNVTFTYGTPRKRCIYRLDNGHLVHPASGTKWNLIFDYYLPTLLKQPLKRDVLSQALWGALNCVFCPKTIEGKLNEALREEVIAVNDKGLLCLPDVPAPKKHRMGAISMKTDRYTIQHGSKASRRKPFIKFGEIKIVIQYDMIPEGTAKQFTQHLLLSVLQGKALEEIKCETENKNCTIVCVDDMDKAELLETPINEFCDNPSFDSAINHLQIEPGTSCTTFIDKLNAALSHSCSHFVFVFGIEKLSFNTTYNIEWFLIELKTIARRYNVALMGSYDPEELTFDDETDDICYICLSFPATNYNIYSVCTKTGEWNLDIRIMHGYKSRLIHVDSTTQKRAYQKEAFYGCKDEGWQPYSRLKTLYNEPISLRTLYDAEGYFVEIDRKKKQFKYIGK